MDDIVCPKCGNGAITKIIYTKPPSRDADRWYERMKADGAALGGDVIHVNSPAYICKSCGNRFGIAKIYITD